MTHRLRTHFFAGLLLLAPLFFTLLIVTYLVRLADAFIVDPFFNLLPLPTSGLANEVLTKLAIAAVVILFIMATGLLAEKFVFRRIMLTCEACVKSIPLLNKLYGSLKDIVNAFLGDKKGVFKRVVFIEYPRNGIWTLGFVTQERRWLLHDKIGQDEMLTVFVPTPPNPATGLFVFVPNAQVIETGLSIEEGLKIVISGGTAVPPSRKSP